MISIELKQLVDPNNECCCEHCLSNKCKEWAFWNDYRILIKMTIPDIYRSEHKINYTFEIYHTDGTLKDVHSWLDTEPEAVIKAAQWVLDNKDKR